MRAIAIAMVLAACGSSPKPVAQPKPEPVADPKPPPPECAAVADKIAAIMAQEDPDAPADSVKAKTGVVKTRCEADQWSAEARECFGTAETAVDAKGCHQFLTEAQMTAVGQEVDGTESTPAVEQAPAVPPEAKKADEAAPRRSRGGTPKKPVPRSSDPCLGGE